MNNKRYTDNELEVMWNELEDVPVNDEFKWW